MKHILLKTKAVILLVFIFSGLVPVVFAQGGTDSGDVTPHQTVDSVTEELMATVRKHSALLQTKPEEYFAEVRKVLDPAINFRYIAKNVMGKHWGTASAEQQIQFVESFSSTLVETYAKGMASFVDFEFSAVPPTGEVPSYGRTTVIQEVKTNDGTAVLAYILGRAKGGEWQLINVTIEGANLGKTYRSQFDRAVLESEGDIAKAITSWNAK